MLVHGACNSVRLHITPDTVLVCNSVGLHVTHDLVSVCNSVGLHMLPMVLFHGVIL